MTRQGTRTCTQQSNRSRGGGAVGNSNDGNEDDNDEDDDNDNNDDGGCGGRDGHHRMRKGRGHDGRTNTTIKSVTEEGGKMVVKAVTMAMTMTMMLTMMKPWSDRGCGDGKWQAVATAVAVTMRGCFGIKIRHPR